MSNAWQYKAEFDPKGKCRKKEISIGSIVVWAVVIIIAIVLGAKLPVSVWTSLPWK